MNLLLIEIFLFARKFMCAKTWILSFGANFLLAFLNYAWYNQKAQDRKFSLHISSGRQLSVETCRDDERRGWGDFQLKKGWHKVMETHNLVQQALEQSQEDSRSLEKRLLALKAAVMERLMYSSRAELAQLPGGSFASAGRPGHAGTAPAWPATAAWAG